MMPSPQPSPRADFYSQVMEDGTYTPKGLQMTVRGNTPGRGTKS